MIRVIPTKYNGYYFRSRLEARWAVFFDTLGLKYEYEKEGFDLGGAGRYLPDFWLPELKLWCEIKGELHWVEKKDKSGSYVTASEWGLMEAFRDAQSYPICLIVGSPGNHQIWFSGYSMIGYLSGALDDTAIWIIGGSGKATLDIEDRETTENVCTKELEPLPWFNDHPQDKSDSIINRALEKARSARFEFGETPVVNRMPLSLVSSSGAW